MSESRRWPWIHINPVWTIVIQATILTMALVRAVDYLTGDPELDKAMEMVVSAGGGDLKVWGAALIAGVSLSLAGALIPQAPALAGWGHLWLTATYAAIGAGKTLQVVDVYGTFDLFRLWLPLLVGATVIHMSVAAAYFDAARALTPSPKAAPCLKWKY